MPLTWSDELFATGNAVIDGQHKELFRRLNLLGDAMEAGRAPEAIGPALDFVDVYAKEHFCCEEDLMELTKCRGCKANKEQHQEFIANLHGIREKYQTGGYSLELVNDVYRLLMRWCVRHIAGVDTALRESTMG